VGLLRFTLDITRRRLELFAEIGAVEVTKGAVVPLAPGTDAWWRAAVREAVYAPLEAQYVWETVNWTSLLKKGLGDLQLLQRLDPLSNLKPSLLHVSRYLLNCSWSMGAVFFT
jgi:hypothetical protein